MTGNEVYEEKFKKKAEDLINRNLDKKEYLKGFYNFLKLGYSTKYQYLFYVVSFMNSNRKLPRELTLDDYNNYLSSIEGNTQSYQISVYSGLKQFSLYLYASKKNDDNPMQYIPRPGFFEGIETQKKRENGYLDENEIEKYLNNLECNKNNSKWIDRDILIIKLLLYTGLRCSALFKLNVENIDFEKSTLVAIDKGNKTFEFYLEDDLIKCINNWMKMRSLILDKKEESALFISNQLRRMDQRSIARVVNKYSIGITEKHITPHKLRATCGTQLLIKTNDIYLAQQYLGHASPKTTELYIRGQKNSIIEKGGRIMSELIFLNSH